MTTPAILIAALSGRALAASARRAGFVPLVVDAFGDADMRESAGAVLCLPAATRSGFRATPLLAALEALARGAGQTPMGLVLGSGFEDTPKLIATLGRHFALIGNDAEAVARAKDPAVFFALLDDLGIAHPETILAPPRARAGWLSKRIGGSGGVHVVDCEKAKSSRGRYFQRRLNGQPVSVLAVAQRNTVRIVGFSRQWTMGTELRPYRYGGAAGPVALAPAAEARMRGAVEAVSTALTLAGIVSFDFLLEDDVPHLLEVNPRPSATLDIFDDPSGTLFHAHIAACRGEPFEFPRTEGGRSAAVLYADGGAVTPGFASWPAWTADRPRPGIRIPRHRPVATVHASGATAAEAEQTCRRRLDELAEMLYGRTGDRESNNAKVYRPRPERIGTSSQAR